MNFTETRHCFTGTDNKLTRVDAQSPIPTTQTSSQSTHQQQQHFINLPYGYYYPSVLPNAAAAAGFQFPGTPMFPVRYTLKILF
jgi:hypothetical protein